MQGKIRRWGKKVKKTKDGKYVDRYGIKIWSKTNEWLDVAQEIRQKNKNKVQGEIRECGKKVKRAKKREYMYRYRVQIWRSRNE